ncbi:MAG: hypothetical protein HYX92_20830 [Chloroflexi bacterium]|nr:hypothetical protein [Chloroflexota bacterium]
MRTRRLLATAGCLAVLGLLLASCAPALQPTPASKAASPPPATTVVPTAARPAAPSPTAKPAPTESGPRYGGVLTIGIGGDPVSLDTQREESTFTYSIGAGTYNLLLKYDPRAWPEFKPVPDLAASWELSPDGKVYTFRLAKGVKFHDGAPFTAEDVKFSLDRIRDPQFGLVKSPRRLQLAAVASIDTPDEYTVKIALSRPQASFVPLISNVYFPIYPKHVVLENKNDMTKTALGSGPFKFKSYTSGVGWELVRNADYFVKGRPYLDGVKGYVMVDSFTRFAALRTRNILWYAPFPFMSASQTKIIEGTLSDKIALVWRSQPTWYGAILNVAKPPWNDVRVRQALSMTFDRKRMVAIGLEGAGVPGMAALPPGEWALPEEEMMKAPGYTKPDIEGAKKLMAEAGYASGFTAEGLVRAIKQTQDMGVLLKDAAAAVGIDLDLKVVDSAVYQDTLFRKNFSIAAAGFGASFVDPDAQLPDFYLTGASRNWGGYSNSRVDELYVQQSQTIDKAERRKIVWELQRTLLKDVPIPIAYWANCPYAWWKDVRDYFPPVGFNNAFAYQDIWLVK